MNTIVGEDGLIDFLTVLTPSEIDRGIEYIRSQSFEGNSNPNHNSNPDPDNNPKGDSKPLLDQFWNYFQKTYMRKSDHHEEKGSVSLSLPIYEKEHAAPPIPTIPESFYSLVRV